MKPALAVIPEKWSWHHRALSRLRDTLRKERDERSLAAREPAERGGADVIDVANDACELESLLALVAQEQTELAEVDAALARIRAGTYGVCELTGEPIDRERLRAVPWTRFSRPAAAQQERA